MGFQIYYRLTFIACVRWTQTIDRSLGRSPSRYLITWNKQIKWHGECTEHDRTGFTYCPTTDVTERNMNR
uniref:Putative secreted protein n=1 Tax=Anopheles darlingi TaxID=43151 RepID=A0A2M4DHV8_ANODA